MRTFPKKWIPMITAMQYVKYFLEDDDTSDKFRNVSVMFFKADWDGMFHVIIEDMEMDSPDYYFMNEKEILENFGEIDFVTKK